MKAIIIIVLLFHCLNPSSDIKQENLLANGAQPQITIDITGTIRVIYGLDDRIFCATSTDNGVTFSTIKLVGEVKEMHLGMSRGPQVASSKNYTLVSAIDKNGTIHTFLLEHQSGIWSKKNPINDVAGSAPEGLMSLTADSKDNFYAVWLDIRDDRKNKICYAFTTDQSTNWSKNKISYQSPEGTVCECCKPSIAVNNSNLLIMFRNWINESRDLYLLTSTDRGRSFKAADKLGNGTWKLKGCPMDGGGLVINSKNVISTVWQREGSIYLSQPNQQEEKIGSGRNCSITDPESPIISWNEGSHLKLKELATGKEYELAEGMFIKAIRTANGKILCVWENEDKVIFARL